jgi:hypothetical protein
LESWPEATQPSSSEQVIEAKPLATVVTNQSPDWTATGKVGHLKAAFGAKHQQWSGAKNTEFRQHSADFSWFFGTMTLAESLATNRKPGPWLKKPECLW